MSLIQIPNLGAAISLNGNEQLEVVQAGVSVRATVAQIAAYTLTGPITIGGNLTVAGSLTVGSSTLISSSVTLTNGAASHTGTLTNAPAIGNPTKWIPINDNGMTRYIPQLGKEQK